MFTLIRGVCIGLLCFIRFLASKCVLLINEPCMIRLTFIDPNHVELNYYPFIISLDKCSGSCNFVIGFCTKICVPSKRK